MAISLQPGSLTNSVTSASEQLEALCSRLAGELITADSDQYDVPREVQDITVDCRPLALVRAPAALDVAEAAHFAPDHSRLADINRRYDPKNLFKFNQHIRPRP
jgi:berberine-like enzyme